MEPAASELGRLYCVILHYVAVCFTAIRSSVLNCSVVECQGEMDAFDPLTGVAVDEQRISQGMKLFTPHWTGNLCAIHTTNGMAVRSWW